MTRKHLDCEIQQAKDFILGLGSMVEQQMAHDLRLLVSILEICTELERMGDYANYVLWVGHNLERMADRVTNICERTICLNGRNSNTI